MHKIYRRLFVLFNIIIPIEVDLENSRTRGVSGSVSTLGRSIFDPLPQAETPPHSSRGLGVRVNSTPTLKLSLRSHKSYDCMNLSDQEGGNTTSLTGPPAFPQRASSHNHLSAVTNSGSEEFFLIPGIFLYCLNFKITVLFIRGSFKFYYNNFIFVL